MTSHILYLKSFLPCDFMRKLSACNPFSLHIALHHSIIIVSQKILYVTAWNSYNVSIQVVLNLFIGELGICQLFRVCTVTKYLDIWAEIFFLSIVGSIDRVDLW